jgi:two-component system response regulator FixJ
MPDPVVHVIDDDDAARESLDFLLGSAGLTTKVYASGEDFVAQLGDIDESGCVVTDVRMPGMSGLELLRHLKQKNLAMPVIVMTGHGDIALAVEAMKAGAIDFIEKPFDDELMVRAVRGALQRDADAHARDAEQQEIARRLSELSGRERQVLDGLVAGHANKIIAYNLGISPRTVEVYRANLMTKMGASSLSELVRMALLLGGTAKR